MENKSEYHKQYYQENKDKIKLNAKQYFEDNKDKIKEYQKNYNKSRDKNYHVDKNYQKEWREANKDIIKAKAKEYREANKDIIRAKAKEYVKFKRETDPMFKFIDNIKTNIRQSLTRNGFKKLSHTEQILGCSYKEFHSLIESKFESWMTWENQGNPKDGIYELNKTWDIDHIIPISTAINEYDVIKLNHHTNLQPLCSYTNRFIKKDNPI